MTDVLELYQLADDHKHSVFWYEDEIIDSVEVLKKSEKCAIAINPCRIENTTDEKYKLAHELGHCETGSFYNIYSPADLIGKHEYRAEKWAIKKLLPKQELIKAFREGNYLWEVAEMFEVPEELVQKAAEYYEAEELY